MWADGNRLSCRSRRACNALSSVDSMALAKATPIRALISAAAAFVKVTTISSCTDKGFSISFNRVIIRSTRTAVLPEPAAAATSKV